MPPCCCGEETPPNKRGQGCKQLNSSWQELLAPSLARGRSCLAPLAALQPPLAGKRGEGCPSSFSFIVLLPWTERRAQRQRFGLSLQQSVPGPVLLPGEWMLLPKAGGLLTRGHFCQLKPQAWFLISVEGFTGQFLPREGCQLYTGTGQLLNWAQAFYIAAGQTDNLLSTSPTSHICSPEISTTLRPQETSLGKAKPKGLEPVQCWD